VTNRIFFLDIEMLVLFETFGERFLHRSSVSSKISLLSLYVRRFVKWSVMVFVRNRFAVLV